MKRPLPKSPYLNERFRNSVDDFGLKLKRSASTNQTSNKGSAREQFIRDFFQANLPAKFSVTQGEAIDLLGETSQQLDLVIYDNSKNFPLFSTGISILPAEAVLATVEVKSRLNSGELKKCVMSSEKLRALRPFNRPLAGTNVGNAEVNRPTHCRFFHSIFAYDSDLTEKQWGEKELNRITHLSSRRHLLDLVYVLNRGILNVPANMYRIEDEKGGAISSFYFAILNFVIREFARRRIAPYDKYVTHTSDSWTKVRVAPR